jgi:hypothetical protein
MVKLKLSLYLMKHHTMKTSWRMEASLHALLASVQDEGEFSTSSPPLYLHRKRARYRMDTGMGEPQNRSGRGNEEKKNISPYRVRIEPQEATPYPRHYTDRATAARKGTYITLENIT